MKRFVLYIAAVTCLASCKDEGPTPEGILKPAKMQAMIWDLLQAQEFISGFAQYKDTINTIAQLNEKWFDKVYSIHQVSKADFQRSYAWYREHPAEMKPIFDSLSKKSPPESATPLPIATVDSGKTKQPVKLIDREKRLDSIRKRRAAIQRPHLKPD